MTYLLLGFLVIVLVPLFAATWRTSLVGLALQGLLLGWLALRLRSDLSTSGVLLVADLLVVRGVLVPRLLYRVLSRHNTPRRNNVIRSDMFSWALVGALVFISFRFASALLKTDLTGSLHLAIATTSLLLGLFVLSSQNSMFSQMVGLLRIENAIVLFELMSPHHFVLPVQVGIAAVFLLTVLLFRRFLEAEAGPRGVAQSSEERPTL